MPRLGMAALAAILSGMAAGGWAQGEPADPSPPPGAAPPQVVVMSMNLYLGPLGVPTVLAVRSGCPGWINAQVTKTWQKIQLTDFSQRADAIACQIVARRPDLIGLQEMMLFRSGPPDGLEGNPTRAEQVELDFLAILLEKLACRGLPYTPVAITEETDVELPGCLSPAGTHGPAEPRDLRMTDRVGILVRTDLLASGVQLFNVQGARFDAHEDLKVGPGGYAVPICMGWNSVDVAWGERTFRFVNTVLELNNLPRLQRVQLQQTEELIRGPLSTNLPVILVGDSNSPAQKARAPAYEMLLGAGLHDAWLHTHPGEPGYTWGNRPYLRNPIPMAYKQNRFDLILFRDRFQAVAMQRVGIDRSERTVTGMWPSDHAGVIATLRLDCLPADSSHGSVGRASRSGGGPAVAKLDSDSAGRVVSERIGLRRPTNHLRDLVPPYDE